MIEKLSHKPILAVVADNDEIIDADTNQLIQLYQ